MSKKLPLVINIRGNSGSGKTTLARAFMRLGHNLETHQIAGANNGDTVFKLGNQAWAVIGKYDNVCGGTDTIKTQQQIIDRVEFYVMRKYRIWFEGLIVSTIYGAIGAYSEKFKDRWIFAYLDTPLNVCLERVLQRRAAAGNTKPFNDTNTRNRAATIARNREIVLSKGRRVVDLPYQNALAPLLEIIRKEG